MPSPLLLAFEKGYNALGGIYAQDITTWAELKQVEKELKKPEVKERFKSVIIDTVDVAATLCDKYVCAQNDVDTISQIPYGQGWNLLKKEFEGVFRRITQMGYAVYFISHSKEVTIKRKDGTEYTMIKPSVSNTYNSIVENMADLYGYMHPVIDKEGKTKVVISFRSTDGTVSCGGRFKYMPAETASDYDSVVAALNAAIDKEAETKGTEFVTEERNVVTLETEYDFDALMAEFTAIVNDMVKAGEEAFNKEWAPRITQIVETYLGKGKKVSNCTRGQAEMLSLIVTDMKELKSKFDNVA